jgi:subtilisin family serine protease
MTAKLKFQAGHFITAYVCTLERREKDKMKSKLSILAVAIATMLATSMIQMSTAQAPPTLERINIGFGVDPAREECFAPWNEWCDLPEGTVPFNVDMVDAEKTCQDGEGIYVAVLDTGLLSNYLDFFPESMVDIKEEWGIGYTHDVWYDPTGEGNWSTEYVDGLEYKFSYKPLRSDRGFINYDDGNPLWSYYPPLDVWFPFPYGSGHGTHVTSIVTGWQLDRTDGQFWVRGVAPKVTLIPVLVLDDWIVFADDGEGWWWSGGTWEMVAAGIRYIGDLAKEHGVKIIINMSLGGSSPSPLEEAAINYAIEQGVIVVASAGNDGYEGMGWPGAFPQVISVAAAGWTQEYLRYGLGTPDPWYWWTDDVPENLWTEDPLGNEFQVYLTDFSSRPNEDLGQEIWHLDVSAPGAGVKGPYKPYGSTQWGYYSVWGTSQAAPHIAGIAALVLDKYPNIEQCKMELILKTSGLFHRLTKWFEEERTATIFDIFTYDLLDQTWLWKDYGTGLVQVDEALWVARLMHARRGRSGWRHHAMD